MAKNLYFIFFIMLLLAACYVPAAPPITTPKLVASPESNATSTQAENPETPATLPKTTSSSTYTPYTPPNGISTPTVTPFFSVQPIIHEQSGEMFETIFKIPIGAYSIINYLGGDTTGINGPNAIAVLPDDSIIIADPVGNRLIYYDQAGSLLNTVELNDLGIKTVVDLRAKDSKLFLLETGQGPDPQRSQVHQLSQEGKLIDSYEIPYQFPVGNDLTLDNVLTGITIDCDGTILLEVAGGSELYHLTDIQTQPDLANVTNGYRCNDELYRVVNPGPKQVPKILAGDATYETRLTTGLGGFSLLDVYPAGNFFVMRNDIVSDSVIQVDQTIHYIGADGVIQGVARIPLTEYYYPVMRKAAISQKGDVFVLLPRPDSIDIIRLNFYKRIEPLIPNAEAPIISRIP